MSRATQDVRFFILTRPEEYRRANAATVVQSILMSCMAIVVWPQTLWQHSVDVSACLPHTVCDITQEHVFGASGLNCYTGQSVSYTNFSTIPVLGMKHWVSCFVQNLAGSSHLPNYEMLRRTVITFLSPIRRVWATAGTLVFCAFSAAVSMTECGGGPRARFTIELCIQDRTNGVECETVLFSRFCPHGPQRHACRLVLLEWLQLSQSPPTRVVCFASCFHSFECLRKRAFRILLSFR